MRVSLREVTRENYEAVCELAVTKEQAHFLASNTFSLVESKFEDGRVPRAIYLDEQPVGFLMWELYPDRTVGISRFMVDKKHQHKGIGRVSFGLALAEIRQDPTLEEIGISYHPKNQVAKDFYGSFGFVERGIDDGYDEMVAIVQLAKRTVSLRKITKENYEYVCNLRAAKSRASGVISNMTLLARAMFTDGCDTRAICIGDDPVGFLMWEQTSADNAKICRFMVAHKHQRQGLGRVALDLALKELRSNPALKEVVIAYPADNQGAKAFYARFGFVETGMNEDTGEMLAVVQFTNSTGIHELPVHQ